MALKGAVSSRLLARDQIAVIDIEKMRGVAAYFASSTSDQ
jgi:hypothetical protein